MSHFTPGLFRGGSGRPAPGTASRGTRQRGAIVLLAVGLDLAAAVMLLSRDLSNALVGLLLAVLGWFATGRVAARHPAPQESGTDRRTRR
ncbi:hypothetical protein [Streptomyces sp. 142MFCol3.1]|uniref:hypothetical protein n=1 Tax=Streptomyces sp. 142MFCol3.1 TaxID=1172179 RepID=UPI0003F710ED|nr:hypothetical protein [Streptomyces sp. 142MFCol3.1]